MKRALIVLAVLVVAAIAWVVIRNPEHLDLTAEARQGVPGQFATLSDGVTHYEVGGPEDGPRVMLVHGFSVPSYIWDSTFVALTTAGFRVARYDTYGRGWSDRPDVPYTLALYDRQLGDLLDSLGWDEPVHLIGLSFGGPVTGQFTAQHPTRVRTLTLVDPAAGQLGSVPSFFGWPVIGEALFQAIAVPTMADGQASDFVNPGKWPDWADRYRVQQQYRGFGRSLLRTRLDNNGVSLDSIYARVGATGRPSLLLWGTEDQTVPIARAADVQRAIPHIEFHAIERAGHLPHMERSDVLHPLLLTFLRAH